MISIIVARDRNGVIGRSGKLPWENELPADLARFARLTIGHPVIMGRKTYESLPAPVRPLPGRTNIVMTRSHSLRGDFLTAWSIEEAINLARQASGSEEIFVIGGKSVYDAAVAVAGRIYLTEIDADFEGETTWVGIDESWFVVASEARLADHRNFYDLRFVVLEREVAS